MKNLKLAILAIKLLRADKAGRKAVSALRAEMVKLEQENFELKKSVKANAEWATLNEVKLHKLYSGLTAASTKKGLGKNIRSFVGRFIATTN